MVYEHTIFVGKNYLKHIGVTSRGVYIRDTLYPFDISPSKCNYTVYSQLTKNTDTIDNKVIKKTTIYIRTRVFFIFHIDNEGIMNIISVRDNRIDRYHINVGKDTDCFMLNNQTLCALSNDRVMFIKTHALHKVHRYFESYHLYRDIVLMKDCVILYNGKINIVYKYDTNIIISFIICKKTDLPDFYKYSDNTKTIRNKKCHLCGSIDTNYNMNYKDYTFHSCESCTHATIEEYVDQYKNSIISI